MFFAKPGRYHISVTTSPTLDIVPERKLGLAVSIDDGPRQVAEVFAPETRATESFLGRSCYENEADNARLMRFSQTITTAGHHAHRISMVDPTVLVEKIVIHDQELPTSYFGPPCRPLNDHPAPSDVW